MINVSNIFIHPPRCIEEGTGFFLFPPNISGGLRGGNKAIKITANHFSNNLLGLTQKVLKSLIY